VAVTAALRLAMAASLALCAAPSVRASADANSHAIAAAASLQTPGTNTHGKGTHGPGKPGTGKPGSGNQGTGTPGTGTGGAPPGSGTVPVTVTGGLLPAAGPWAAPGAPAATASQTASTASADSVTQPSPGQASSSARLPTTGIVLDAGGSAAQAPVPVQNPVSRPSQLPRLEITTVVPRLPASDWMPILMTTVALFGLAAMARFARRHRVHGLVVHPRRQTAS
jgi:hypothetical protein